MSTSSYLPDDVKNNSSAMIFVDGENLSIRYNELLNGKSPKNHISFEKDIYIWSSQINRIRYNRYCSFIRKYYYSSVQGDEDKVNEVKDKLKAIGIQSPIIFKKQKGKRSKRVDITLAVDMLKHAYNKNMDIAILVAGDEDYIPLVKAVKDAGCIVCLWFFEDCPGLSKKLKMEVDYFFDISWFLFKTEDEICEYYS